MDMRPEALQKFFPGDGSFPVPEEPGGRGPGAGPDEAVAHDLEPVGLREIDEAVGGFKIEDALLFLDEVAFMQFSGVMILKCLVSRARSAGLSKVFRLVPTPMRKRSPTAFFSDGTAAAAASSSLRGFIAVAMASST